MFGKSVLNELSPYKQGMQIEEVQRKYNLKQIVKLSSNENPYGFSKDVQQFLEQASFQFQFYPDGYALDLRTTLANKLSVQEDQLVFGSGSDEIITLICRAFLHNGTNTVMAHPTFPQYRHHALIEGAEIKEIETLEDGSHDLNGMLKAIDSETKVVWLCSPDNPTGTLISKDEIEQFMEQCPKNVLVVLDEAYFEYVDKSLQTSFDDLLVKHKNIIFLRTFSKIYGLAGLRVGYGISTEEIANKLNIVRGPFNTTSLSQQIAAKALEKDDFIEEMRVKNSNVKKNFEQFLDSIGWEYYESHANFLLVKTPICADQVANYLLKHGYIVRSGNLLGYKQTVRVTIGKDRDMQELQKVLSTLQIELN